MIIDIGQQLIAARRPATLCRRSLDRLRCALVIDAAPRALVWVERCDLSVALRHIDLAEPLIRSLAEDAVKSAAETAELRDQVLALEILADKRKAEIVHLKRQANIARKWLASAGAVLGR